MKKSRRELSEVRDDECIECKELIQTHGCSRGVHNATIMILAEKKYLAEETAIIHQLARLFY
jgi:hypothetical protein